MTGTSVVWSRSPVDVVSRAGVTGAAVGAPVTFAAFTTFAVGQSLAEGDLPSVALRAAMLTSDDWEIFPVVLLGSVVVGAVVAAIAAGVWLAVAGRAPTKLWLAHVAAAGVAAGLAALPLVASRPLALWTALLVGVVAVLAAPRVCLERARRTRARAS